jgi:hypothetical protein
MGIFGDDNHPDPVATALHKILDFFLVLIGIGICIMSVYYVIILKSKAGLAVAMLVVGIGTIIFAVVGMFGSGCVLLMIDFNGI